MSIAQGRARLALADIARDTEVGEFIGTRDDGDGVRSYLWSSTMSGYPDWVWTVSVAERDGDEPSVLELELLPGPDSIVAPGWVPWSVRLAEYREAQKAAALAAARASSAGDSPTGQDHARLDGDGELDEDDDEDDDLVGIEDDGAPAGLLTDDEEDEADNDLDDLEDDDKDDEDDDLDDDLEDLDDLDDEEDDDLEDDDLDDEEDDDSDDDDFDEDDLDSLDDDYLSEDDADDDTSEARA